jgi:hypothetical protein
MEGGIINDLYSVPTESHTMKSIPERVHHVQWPLGGDAMPNHHL